jgi:hypothetical protein
MAHIPNLPKEIGIKRYDSIIVVAKIKQSDARIGPTSETLRSIIVQERRQFEFN